MLLRAIRAEFLKLRRSFVWLALLILPLISAGLGTANYLNNLGSKTMQCTTTQCHCDTLHDTTVRRHCQTLPYDTTQCHCCAIPCHALPGTAFALLCVDLLCNTLPLQCYAILYFAIAKLHSTLLYNAIAMPRLASLHPAIALLCYPDTNFPSNFTFAENSSLTRQLLFPAAPLDKVPRKSV